MVQMVGTLTEPPRERHAAGVGVAPTREDVWEA